MKFKIEKPPDEWKEQLSVDAYRVLIEGGTDRPFEGKYCLHYEPGTYVCAACGNPLFGSYEKYDSGTGWPSFFEPHSDMSVGTRPDGGHWLPRTEVHCARCGGHLGYVFDDGPPPTGMRYCISSSALDFRKEL